MARTWLTWQELAPCPQRQDQVEATLASNADSFAGAQDSTSWQRCQPFPNWGVDCPNYAGDGRGERQKAAQVLAARGPAEASKWIGSCERDSSCGDLPIYEMPRGILRRCGANARTGLRIRRRPRSHRTRFRRRRNTPVLLRRASRRIRIPPVRNRTLQGRNFRVRDQSVPAVAAEVGDCCKYAK